MKLKLSAKVRAFLYVLTALGTPVVSYLALKGVVGELEVGLWTGLVTVVSSLAAFNVTPDEVEE